MGGYITLPMHYNRIEFMEYITPDSQVFRFDDTARFLISETGFGMPGVDYISQQGPFQHGNTIYDYRLQPRIIQLVMRENACSRTNYWANRARLIDYLRPNRQFLNEFELGVLRKILPDKSKRDIQVFIEQGPEFSARDPKRWDEWSFTETLRFIAPNPTFYDPDLISSSWESEDTPHLVLPFTFNSGPSGEMFFQDEDLTASIEIDYPGTWLSYPTIVITGPLDNPIITNLQTGEQIDLSSYSIVNGEVITVSLEYGNKTINSSLNGNIIAYVGSTSDLATFHIACHPEATNGINQITIQGGNMVAGITNVTVSYFVRYIGI